MYFLIFKVKSFVFIERRDEGKTCIYILNMWGVMKCVL